MGRLFGTDGVRGVANTELTPELALSLGRAGAYVLTKQKKQRPKILIGIDTRISCEMLEAALSAGMCSVGAHVYCAGVIPTPAVAYLTRHYGFDAGVVISASHNTFSDNGIKFFNGDGYKLPDSMENEIEDLIIEIMKDDRQLYINSTELPRPDGDGIGKKILYEQALENYASFLCGTAGGSLSGMKIALDCANGAAYKLAPNVFEQLGANVYVINNEPDGTNINKNCGSVHIEGLQAYVKEISANIGFAFDGDGDRLIAVDNDGNVLSGDEIMAILALDLKRKSELRDDTLVATIMSNSGLRLLAQKYGIKLIETKVGDRYVIEEMRKGGYSLGGEQSGHVIMLKHNTTGDGVLTAVQLAAIMQTTQKKPSELHDMIALPQVTINVIIDNKRKTEWSKDKEIEHEIQKLEQKLCGVGRVLIRPSGTEPLIRIMLEGRDHIWLHEEACRLAEIIKSKMS